MWKQIFGAIVETEINIQGSIVVCYSMPDTRLMGTRKEVLPYLLGVAGWLCFLSLVFNIQVFGFEYFKQLVLIVFSGVL